MNNFIWLVRREFWENKAIWVMPACIGALMLLAGLFGKVQIAMPHTSDQQSELAAVLSLLAVGGVFWVAMSIYSVWYLLDCLYADRKDRSVLFFKSLPLTDSPRCSRSCSLRSLRFRWSISPPPTSPPCC